MPITPVIVCSRFLAWPAYGLPPGTAEAPLARRGDGCSDRADRGRRRPRDGGRRLASTEESCRIRTGSFLLISVIFADRQFGACANVACAMPLAQSAIIAGCNNIGRNYCLRRFIIFTLLSSRIGMLGHEPKWQRMCRQPQLVAIFSTRSHFGPRVCMKPAWAVRASSHAPTWVQRSSVKRPRSASNNPAAGSAVQGERQCQPPTSPAWHSKNLAEMLAHVWPSVGSK
jgi:hypothetical protein